MTDIYLSSFLNLSNDRPNIVAPIIMPIIIAIELIIIDFFSISFIIKVIFLSIIQYVKKYQFICNQLSAMKEKQYEKSQEQVIFDRGEILPAMQVQNLQTSMLLTSRQSNVAGCFR